MGPYLVNDQESISFKEVTYEGSFILPSEFIFIVQETLKIGKQK